MDLNSKRPLKEPSFRTSACVLTLGASVPSPQMALSPAGPPWLPLRQPTLAVDPHRLLGPGAATATAAPLGALLSVPAGAGAAGAVRLAAYWFGRIVISEMETPNLLVNLV